MKLKNLLYASMISAVVVAPQMALAESDTQFGGSGTIATAHLNFSVVIQDFVYFQVGDVGGNVNTLEWVLGAAQAGGATPLDPTTNDAGPNGDVPVVLWSNSSQVTLAVDSFSLSNGTDTIPNTEILVTNPGVVNAPTDGSPQPIDTSGLASLSDTWSYQYADSAVYPRGTYNGQATYTATTL